MGGCVIMCSSSYSAPAPTPIAPAPPLPDKGPDPIDPSNADQLSIRNTQVGTDQLRTDLAHPSLSQAPGTPTVQSQWTIAKPPPPPPVPSMVPTVPTPASYSTPVGRGSSLPTNRQSTVNNATSTQPTASVPPISSLMIGMH